MASRLDRFIVSMNWDEFFPNMFQRRLSRPFSDHFLICLETLVPDGGSPHSDLRTCGLNMRASLNYLKSGGGSCRSQVLLAS